MNYNQFAWYYDSLMEPKFYEDYFHFIKENASFKSVLDLGCGTGRLDAQLMNENITLDGIDLSKQMIDIASSTIQNAHFEVADMLTYQSDKKYDLVLCVCDSLNYILGFDNQVQILKNVYDYLNEDGTFIFDVHSQYKINELFKNYIEEDENEDFYFYWKVKKTNEYQITHYVIIEDLNEDVRMEEKHVQESYPIEWYVKALKEIGYKDITYNETFQENERVVFKIKK